MSEETMQLMERYYRALSRTLAAYTSGPIEETPFMDEFFAVLAEDVEWDWVFTPEVFKGREELLRAATDWLSAVDDWAIDVDELIDAGDKVVATLRIHAIGKESRAPVDQRVFSVVTVRDSKVVRIHDHLDRESALETAGLGA